MIVEKLPIKREWEFYDNDDIVITFSMTNAGVAVPINTSTAIAQIRDADLATATLISTGTCVIANNIITVTFPLADLAGRVGDTVYGELRIQGVDTKKVTLLKFSATINATFSRFV